MELIGVRRFLRTHLSIEQRRLIKFLVVGASGVPVNLCTVWLVTTFLPPDALAGLRDLAADIFDYSPLTRTGVRDIVAYGLAIAVSIFTNYLLNSAWTWGDRVAADESGGFIWRLAKFYLVSSVAAAVQLGTSTFVSASVRSSELWNTVISGEFRLYHAFSPVVGILAGLTINFVVNNLWTFRRRSNDGA